MAMNVKNGKQSTINYADATGMLAWLMKKTGRPDKKNVGVSRRSRAASYIPFYMMVASIFGACGKLTGLNMGGKDANPDNNIQNNQIGDSIDFVMVKADLANFDTLKINPRASDKVWKSQIEKVMPYIVAHTFLHEEFIDHVYSDNGSKGTPTLGAGFTIKDAKHRKAAEKVLGRKLKKDETVTLAEARALMEYWYDTEIFPKMKAAFKKPMSARLFVGLSVAAYNAGESTYSRKGNSGYPVREAVNNGESIHSIAKKYVRQFGKIRGTKWSGMPNKYAIMAMYMDGKISNEAILNSIAGAPYALEDSVAKYQQEKNLTKSEYESGRLLIYDGIKKDARAKDFFVPGNIEQMLTGINARTTMGTKQKRVRDYMPVAERLAIQSDKILPTALAKNHIEPQKPHANDTKTPAAPKAQKPAVTTTAEYKSAIADFRAKNYAAAAKKFEKLTVQYPNDALLCNDLGLTYDKLGRYDDAINMSRRVLREIGDRSQYAAAQYNAGFAYEKKGDLERALANYKLAVENGSAGVAKDVKRIENKIAENNKKQAKTNNKKMAFDAGKNKLQKRVAALNLAAQKKLNKVQDA